MRRVALEEAFSYGGLISRRPVGGNPPIRPEVAERFSVKLGDFTDYRLPEMDAHGIDVQVLSLTQPGIQGEANARIAIDDARRANDFLADIISRHPDRFAGLAALPTQAPAQCAGELRRAVTSLGLRGALVNDQTQGRYLDDKSYRPLWAELEQLDVPLYIHPATGRPEDKWDVLAGFPELDGPSFRWAAATAAHFLRLVYSGLFDQFPGVTVILGHMGEFLPFQMARLDARHPDQVSAVELDRKPSEYILDNLMLTTSGVCSHAALLGAIGAVGAGNVMFAVDYPYESTADAVEFLDSVPVGDTERAQIAHGNADRLLGL